MYFKNCHLDNNLKLTSIHKNLVYLLASFTICTHSTTYFILFCNSFNLKAALSPMQ